MGNKRICINPRKKQKIFERDNFICVNCGVSGDFNALEVDHIIAIKDGGNNDESNLQTLCYKCNMDKLYGKNIKNNFLLNFNPIERLELIKKKIENYKDLTWPEFKVIYTLDETFKKLNLGLLDIKDLFHEIAGKKILPIDREALMAQRNKLIYLIHKEYNLIGREINELFEKYKFPLEQRQIERIIIKIENETKTIKTKNYK